VPDGPSSSMSSVLAFDIGGSHISAALCELAQLQILRSNKCSLPSNPSCEEFLDLLVGLGSGLAVREHDLQGAALAFPGPFDFAAGVSRMRHKLESLYGVDLRSGLAERFGWKPNQFRFLHDGGAFLLGEVHSGAARGATRAIGIVLGTGIGSAFAENGRWVTDGDGVPSGGEIWNLPYQGGIVEDLISTKAIRCDYARLTGANDEVITIASRSASDPEACLVFEKFGTNLGHVFRDILAPFRPDVVVIGGGISRAANLFLPSAAKEINGLGFQLVTSRLLDEAPLVGAAAFWRNGIDIGNSDNVELTEADVLRDRP